MFPATVKRYMDLMNINLKGKKKTTKPIGVNTVYVDPKHVVYIRVEPTPVDLTQTPMFYDGAYETDRRILEPIEDPDACTAVFNVDYLRKILDNLAPSTYVKLHMGNTYPIKIEGLLDAETQVTAYVAPIIVTEFD